MRDAQRRRDAADTKPQAVRMLEELARLLLSGIRPDDRQSATRRGG
jgi:hypothetical protein